MLRNLANLALILCGHALPVLAQQDAAASEPAPNVLWIFVEDMNDWLGCSGDDLANTPNLDALAARGTRFTRAYMPAGVCSPTRSAVITSCWQTSIGAHHHRSGRQHSERGHRIRLPDGVRPIPAVLRDAGYYTFNYGKTDYNFAHDPGELYDWHKPNMNFDRIGAVGKLWRPAVRAGKPFFGQIQLRGGKNRTPARTDPAKVQVPPYYPDVVSVRREIAHHYDVIEKTDREVGKILTALRNDRLHERTVVVFFSDHGYRMHRHKQFVYDGSVRVPCIVAGPGIGQAVRSDLISGIDLGATTLALAKVARPPAMHGRDVFADGFARPFVVSARDRCDFTIDRIRAVTTPRFRYLRNYLTDRPYMQPQYRDGMAITKELRIMARDGQLNATQMQFYGPKRPAEELYDLTKDPHEVHNLAEVPAHQGDLAQHRALLARWIEQTGDRGQQQESVASLREVLERWGKRCVNPEYDAARAAMAAEQAGKPRILILGDSISMGYTPVVKRLLRSEANVMRPKENCAGTSKGVAKIDAWLQIDGGNFDLIWFNAGLHDLKRVKPNGKNSNDPTDQRQAEPDVYDQQLRAMVRKLIATGATLVFATTTPVPSGGVRPHRDVADAQRYNGIARRIMAEHGIAVCDLHAFARQHQQKIQPRVDVHFTKEGSAMLGAQVAKAMRQRLDLAVR